MADVAHTPQPYDIVVLGGGSAGYSCAFRASELGLRVALIERDKVGGTCLHYGCIPTKALLHAAEVADTVQNSARFGITSELHGVDMGAVLGYQARVVKRLYTGLQGLTRSRGVTVLEGEGRLQSPTTVTVTGADGETQQVEGRSVVIATGAAPATLPGLEPDGVRVLDSTQALALERVPASVVIVGGGVIGVEFASAWRSLGAEVTIVEALDRLVAGEEPTSSAALQRAFGKRGIKVRTKTRFAGVTAGPDDVEVQLDEGDPLRAEYVLVAVGRRPVTSGLGLEEVGVGLDRGFVRTDERLHTDVPGVYAAGDVVAGLQLAHRGFAHGIFLAEEIAGLAPVPTEDTTIPRVTYSEPELASVGLTVEAAEQEHGAEEIEVLRYDLAGNGRSQILATSGSVTLVRRRSGPVVGIHLVGSRVSELIGEAQLIHSWEAWPDEVAALIHAHPTQSEALGEAHLALAGKPLHVHR